MTRIFYLLILLLTFSNELNVSDKKRLALVVSTYCIILQLADYINQLKLITFNNLLLFFYKVSFIFFILLFFFRYEYIFF
jgi:hypothetical protein